VDHHELYTSLKFNEEVYSLLRTPFFNIWKYNEDQYISLIEHMFQDLHIVTDLKLDITMLRHFLILCKKNYNPNVGLITEFQGLI
jgi:hypothetical protein